ncbi:MAG: hypothetical protein IKU66_03015 [Clostridia bacterium]|nr:hypothetical protein [Clostridia bacterium]
MKKKLSSKKCIALVLAVIMIITSIPFMMVGAVTTGAYDPAPYWGDPDDEYGAINTNFVATLNTDGSIDISFPNAKAQKTYNGSSTKTIDKYVFTLTKLQDDGTRKEIYSEVFTAAQVATGVAGAKYPNNIYYGPGGLESLPDYDVKSTYDVAIMAIDSDGWFSDKIHTLLSDVPYYEISADFSPVETWVAREMLLFGGAGKAQINNQGQTSDGKESGRDYQVYSGSKIDTNGYLAEMGYDRANGGAYRFWINGEYDGVPYSVQTTWSRSHYNFTNAEEVWFFVDFSRANVTKVAFSLSANEKYFEHKKGEDNTIEDVEESKYGALFSTKAVNGVNAGIKDNVYIQNNDGLWIETNMTDGYFTDLGGYKGFVRIPIDYFVLQQDQYITADNNLAGWSGTPNEENLENYISNHWLPANSTLTVPNADGTTRTITSEYLTADQLASYGVSSFWYERGDYSVAGANAFKVNPAGTPVKDAHIINQRVERTTNWLSQVFKRGMGNCLSRYATVSASGTSYTVTNPYYAIQDMVSAGIEVAGWTSDSVAKSFYIDQIMFCQKAEGATFNTDGSVATTSAVKFPDEGGDFAGDLGKKVAGYYDRTVEVPKAIANYIMEYVGEIPSLDDVNAIEMIDDIILNYRECFPSVLATDSDEVVLNKATAHMVNNLGFTEAVHRYNAAKTFIDTYVNLGDTARNYNAVVAFEAGVEKLPNPQFANYNDDALKADLEQLMALYKSFNLSHFEILGAEAEEKFTTLYSIMMGEEVKTGYSIGGYPFIPFNDFEKTINGYNANYSLGQLSLQYYDDSPAVGDKNLRPTDVNNTKNLVTYVTPDIIPQSGQTLIGNASAVGWSVADYRATADNLLSDSNEIFDTSKYFGRMDAEISNGGFAGSQGVKINLDGDITTLDADDNPKFATLSTTYKGQNVNTWTELQGLNLAALQLTDTYADGTTAKDKDRYGLTKTGEQVRPNSFVMYVDFSEVTNIAMNIKFILRKGDTDVNCYFCGGGETATPTIYVLDENGEWTDVQIKVSAIDTSSTSFKVGLCSIASAGTKLEGYKGFVRIPLSMFRIPKRDGLEENYLILENNLNNYTITQAKVSFWDYDTEDKNIGKEINIDAMGFTYDPGCQTRIISDATTVLNTLNANNGLNSDVEKYGIKNMDEYFGVKTNDSVNVEKMIAEIDPYVGKDRFIADCNAVVDAYNKLSPYQKGLKEVDTAYNDLFYNKYLALYQDYDNVINQPEWKCEYQNIDDGSGNVTTAVSQLKTDINNLPYDARMFIHSNYPLPLPSANATLIYPAFGIESKEQAEKIVLMYENGYNRMSKAQQSEVTETELQYLENAYYAAQRILLVEDYMADIGEFSGKITGIYKAGTAEPDVRMVKYGDEGLLKALDLYDEMSVFAKDILEVTAGGAYNNMHAAAEAIYDNSHTITMSNGTAIQGGILIFEEDMLECATKVADKIDVRTVLDTDTLNEIEYYLGQTESFLPRYAQVDEINVAYHKLADLLPTADIETTTTQALLTNDDGGTSYTTDVDLTYVAARLNRKVSVYVVSDHKWTQTTGSTYDFGYFTVNGATGTDGTMIYTKIGDYANGATAEINPVISVDETASKKVPNGAKYSGKIRIVAFDSALITDGVDLSTLTPVADVEIPVVFDSTNGADPMVYEVQIPATVVVDWDDTSDIDVSYKVEATLGGNTLSVSVSDSGAEKGKLVDSTGTHTLDFAATNFKETTFTGDVAAGTTPQDKPSIKVSGWDNVPVGKYSTQLTYTVDVTS